MQIGLQLRQAMLLNGMLFNSEVWHNISEDEVKILERVDELLLRSLVKAHSKLPARYPSGSSFQVPSDHSEKA